MIITPLTRLFRRLHLTRRRSSTISRHLIDAAAATMPRHAMLRAA